jgi:hypothetical protein
MKSLVLAACRFHPLPNDYLMRSGTPEQTAGVTQAFLKMKKFDLAELRRAYAG